ncbi:MAG: sigma-70 family RNA polymerase sigma factor [Sphingomonas sp.]|jgi:RNA polymerase sigma-70 factor (ECF subfamily)
MIQVQRPGEGFDRDAERIALSDEEFKAELVLIIPQLRAFGRSLSGNRDLADDLVQETLMKAWAARSRFQAGTNMRAWTFIILRNLFLSQMRRSRFTGEWDDLTADRLLAAPAGQDRQIELGDVQRALQHLPQTQREALILVGAGGFAYEEAADICGVAVGTIKSRVARGRVALEALLSGNTLEPRARFERGPRSALDTIMGEVETLSQQQFD